MQIPITHNSNSACHHKGLTNNPVKFYDPGNQICRANPIKASLCEELVHYIPNGTNTFTVSKKATNAVTRNCQGEVNII